MAKTTRQDVFGGDKDPLEIAAESAIKFEKNLISAVTVVVDLSNKLKSLSDNAKSLSSLSVVTTGSNLGDLEKQNSLHQKATELLRAEKEAKKALVEAQKLETKAAEESVKAYEKLLNEINKRAAKEEAAAEKREVQYNKEIASANKTVDAYGKVQQKLNGLIAEYRGLGVRKELGIKLTGEEAKRYEFLQQRITKYDSALKSTDASMGRYQRNVGNYASAYNGLGNSVNQLTRELPAFANSMQTGFMAISNNLPIFFDEIQKITKANKELAASGQATTSVFKQVAGAIFSMGSLLSIGVTLLTVYGSKIVEFTASLFSNTEEEKRNSAAKKAKNEEVNKSAGFVGKESAAYVGYLVQLKNTNAGSRERISLIAKINDEYGATLKNLQDEVKFQKMVNGEIDRYIEYQKARYKLQKNEELITANLTKQEKLERELTIAKQKQTNAQRKLNEEQLKNLFNRDKELVLKKYEEALTGANGEVTLLEYALKSADDRLNSYGLNMLTANSVVEDFDKTHVKTTKSVKDLTTELKEFDSELERRLDLGERERKLLQEIREIQEENKIEVVDSIIEKELEGQREYARTTGQIWVDTLEGLIEEEYALRKDAAKQRTAFEIEELEKRMESERAIRFEELDKELEELLKQEGITNSAKIKLAESYGERQKELAIIYLDEQRLVALEIEKINLELQQTLGNIDQEKIDRLNKVNDELIELQKKYGEDSNKANAERLKKEDDDNKKALDAEKKRQKELADLRKKSVKEVLNELKRESEEREKLIDKDISDSERLEERLIEASNAGSDTAADSLAAQKAVTAEKLTMKEQEQKKQEAIARIQVGYEIFESLIDKGESVPAAGLKTVSALKFIQGLLSNIKGFYTGTKRTVGEELGAPLLPGKDGHVIRVDGSEKILNPELSRKTGKATTNEIVAGYLKYDTFRVNNMLAGEPLRRVESDTVHNPISTAHLRKLDTIAQKLDKIPQEFFSEAVIDGVLRAYHVRKSGNDEQRTFHKV